MRNIFQIDSSLVAVRCLMIRLCIPACCSLVLAACAHLPGQPVAKDGVLAKNSPAPAPTAARPTTSAPAASSPATPAATPSSSNTGPNTGPAPSPAPNPGPLRSFAEVTRDATSTQGLFPLWRKEDRVWLELTPEQFNQPLLFAVQRTSGIGTRGLYAHWMMGSGIIEFRRFGPFDAQVQVVLKNFRHQASNNPALKRAAELSFSDSLIASTVVATQPHPQRKSVLVDLNPVLLSDYLPQLSLYTEAAFRISYSFDPRNSHFTEIESGPDESVIGVRAHYFVPRIPTNQAAPGQFQMPLPVSPPNTLVDPRSFFVNFEYTIAALPKDAMRPRLADARIGHFNSRSFEFGNEADYKERRYYVNRWRLEKKDPAAEMSEPVKPITFWLDRNIPVRYREAVKAGVLEWNKAFERIGFKNAIAVENQPETSGPRLAAVRHASIRWFLDTDPGALAIGPSIVDPRTGEILDADIAISNNWVRVLREYLVERAPPFNGSALDGKLSGGELHEGLPAWATMAKKDPRHALIHLLGASHNELCEHGIFASSDMLFAAQLMQARGSLKPDGPEVEKIVNAVLKDVVMHEVGHALGLRHNFRASTATPISKLTDPNWLKTHGLSGSVMDYNGLNIPLKDEKLSLVAMDSLGPYDYWAIEYAYRPLDPETEAQTLAAIAGRSSEPGLAYASDEEAMMAYDPEVNSRDLGSDSLAFAKRRFAQARELWQYAEKRQLKPGESYGALKIATDVAFAQFDQAAELASKWVGGVRYLRDHSGSSRLPFEPVPASRQREALQLVTEQVFAPGALVFDPAFVSRLTQDGLEREGGPPFLPGIYSRVAISQLRILAQLMSDQVSFRLLEAETKALDRKNLLPLSEVYQTVQNKIWSELKTGSDIGLQRRTLQRYHLSRLMFLIMRPATSGPIDSRAVARLQGQQLLAQLKASVKAGSRTRRSAEAQAHLLESITALEESLKAPLVRTS